MWTFEDISDKQEMWAYAPQVFTKEQCQKIITLGESLLPETATTLGGDCSDARDSKVSWIAPSKESEWLFRYMTDLAKELNSRYFNFNLTGFAEGFQFTKYEAPAGKYDLHIDKTYGAQIRKLSIVIQLSDPEDYEGGDLLLQLQTEPTLMHKEQGYLVTFPSYVPHAVTPITKGTRYSLVAWITGPQFK